MKRKTITLQLVAPHYSREYAGADEAAKFWHAADCLLRAKGVNQIQIVTQFGVTLLSRTQYRGQEIVLRHKAALPRATMHLVGFRSGFLPYLRRGEAMDVVLLAAAQTEPARVMGELSIGRAA